MNFNKTIDNKTEKSTLSVLVVQKPPQQSYFIDQAASVPQYILAPTYFDKRKKTSIVSAAVPVKNIICAFFSTLPIIFVGEIIFYWLNKGHYQESELQTSTRKQFKDGINKSKAKCDRFRKWLIKSNHDR